MTNNNEIYPAKISRSFGLIKFVIDRGFEERIPAESVACEIATLLSNIADNLPDSTSHPFIYNISEIWNTVRHKNIKSIELFPPKRNEDMTDTPHEFTVMVTTRSGSSFKISVEADCEDDAITNAMADLILMVKNSMEKKGGESNNDR